MVSTITRRLLRDWKHLTRSISTLQSSRGQNLFYLKPQDSNLHIWHLVLIDPSTCMELYFILYINESVGKEVLIARCLTPCDNFPFNQNIHLSYLYPGLKEHGFYYLIERLWCICFEHTDNSNTTPNSPFNKEKKKAEISNEHIVRMLRAWNRIIYKDFKSYFPELVGFLQPGDYESVKSLSQRVNEYKFGKSSHLKRTFPSENTINNKHETILNIPEVGHDRIDSINIHGCTNNFDLFSTDKAYSCDSISTLKRTRLHLEDLNYRRDAVEDSRDDPKLSAPKRRRL